MELQCKGDLDFLHYYMELNCHDTCLHLDGNIREQYRYLNKYILGCVVACTQPKKAS